MNTVLRWLMIAVLVGVFIGYVSTYTVRFTEKAVVSTLGAAGENSVREDPGIRVKIPWFQRVTAYDTRLRFVETQPETQQTADNKQLIARAFIAWRVDDPLKFYRRFSGAGSRPEDHYAEAERLIRTALRSAMASMSEFELDQLLSANIEGTALPQLEARMLAALRSQAHTDSPERDDSAVTFSMFGVEPVFVGISELELPKDTTAKVFEVMKENRKGIAQETISRGRSIAETIRRNADADSKKIMAFAERLAQQVIAEGEREAAEFQAMLREEPELAVFIRNMEFLRDALKSNTTLVLSDEMPGLNALRLGFLNGLRAGQVPSLDVGTGSNQAESRPATAAAPTNPN